MSKLSLSVDTNKDSQAVADILTQATNQKILMTINLGAAVLGLLKKL